MGAIIMICCIVIAVYTFKIYKFLKNTLSAPVVVKKRKPVKVLHEDYELLEEDEDNA